MEQLTQNLNYISMPTQALKMTCFLPILLSLGEGEGPAPLNCWLFGQSLQ